jgi:hypothetical protein
MGLRRPAGLRALLTAGNQEEALRNPVMGFGYQ